MATLLCLDTAVGAASVCLAKDGKVLGKRASAGQNDSAGWIHQAIQELLEVHHLGFQDLDAIALSAGPGSYTGLRVGMATAKGLCYATGLPLITIDTLQMMAAAALSEPTPLLCPMIDARRMEVFTAVFDHNLKVVQPFQPMILEENSFGDLLREQTVTFFGNGSVKFRPLSPHPHAVFREIKADASHLVPLAMGKWTNREFADLAYAEPFYGKAFFDPRK